jgi:hypothetical protein
MKASEYVKLLQDLIDEFGDLECVDSTDQQIGIPEHFPPEDDGPAVFVLAENAQ